MMASDLCPSWLSGHHDYSHHRLYDYRNRQHVAYCVCGEASRSAVERKETS